MSYKGSGKLEGWKAVITGGDSGIGRAVAIACAREGADILIAYPQEKEHAQAMAARHSNVAADDARNVALCYEVPALRRVPAHSGTMS
jgi:hypothetical protein